MTATFEEEEAMRFNTFPGVFTKLSLQVQDNAFSESWVDGRIRADFLSTTKAFDVRIPVADNGFQPGYLSEELRNHRIVLNEQDAAKKVEVTVQQGYFEANERLNLTVDVAYPAVLEGSLTNLNELKLWGDGRIGFETPDQIIPLSTQTVGTLNSHRVKVDSIGFGQADGYYAFSLRAGLLMNIEMTGPSGGAPRVTAVSGQQVGTASGAVSTSNWAARTQENSSEVPSGEPQILSFVPFLYDMGPVRLSGMMKAAKNDPTYGSYFRLEAVAQLKVPKKLEQEIGALGMWGNVDGTDYFFARLVYSRGSGSVPIGVEGIKLPGTPLQVVGVQATFYKNMKKQSGSALVSEASGEKPSAPEVIEEDFDYKPDGNTGFGGGLQLSMTDIAQRGKDYFIEAGGEMSFTEGGDLDYLELTSQFRLKNQLQSQGVSSHFIIDGRFVRDVSADLWLVEGSFRSSLKNPPWQLKNANAKFEMVGTDWRFDVGTQQKPVTIATRKFSKVSGQGYLSVSKNLTQMGVGVRYQVIATPGWIDLDVVEFRPVVSAEASAFVSAGIGYDNDDVYLDHLEGRFKLYGGIRVDYRTLLKDGTINVASATLEGVGGYRRSEGLYGKLRGEVCFIGMCEGFEIESGNLLQ